MGVYHPIAQSKTARRCASLDRGARAWGAELRYRGGAARGACLITLTFARQQTDAQVSYQIRRFWDSYAKHFRTHIKEHGRFQRLSWLEYQANGRHHYHAIVIDPPDRDHGHDWKQVSALWGQGRTNLKWRNAEWVDRKAVGYAVSYTKKFGSKEYQQQYEKASQTIRTYQTNRLRSADARLERLPRWAYHAASGAGLRLVDGRRMEGGGLRVSAWDMRSETVTPSADYRLSVEHQINWWERAYWPPGTVVIRLGAVHWQPLSTDVN